MNVRNRVCFDGDGDNADGGDDDDELCQTRPLSHLIPPQPPKAPLLNELCGGGEPYTVYI